MKYNITSCYNGANQVQTKRCVSLLTYLSPPSSGSLVQYSETYVVFHTCLPSVQCHHNHTVRWVNPSYSSTYRRYDKDYRRVYSSHTLKIQRDNVVLMLYNIVIEVVV